MTKYIFRYGTISGAFLSIFLIIFALRQDETNQYAEIIGFSVMIVAFSTIYFAIKNNGKNYLEVQ